MLSIVKDYCINLKGKLYEKAEKYLGFIVATYVSLAFYNAKGDRILQKTKAQGPLTSVLNSFICSALSGFLSAL